jgi:ABC-2 type transport system permease protein
LVPDYRAWPASGFKPSAQRGAQLLAVAVEGRFDSYFKGKDSPLAAQPDIKAATGTVGKAANEAEGGDKSVSVTGVIDRSPEAARIILVASDTFADDAVLDLASEGLGTRYAQPVAFLQNAIDWSLAERALLSIRSRAQFARTLVPMQRGDQLFWEYLNYGLALVGLFAVWLWRRRVRSRDRVRYQSILAEV